ncbi:exosporium glycoprotein BclB-related protein [Bacillus salipaludis]|uniref:Exosporium glycoprotein BclB-related protein n=1 Tax=Bacillus salipaludis TaxID=2547811 RepID=A0ABW8RHI9_9BACI
MIPFASGTPVALTNVLGGVLNTGALIGFGSSVDSVTIGGATIDLDGIGGVLGFAFVAPRAGTLSSISAFFSVTAGVTISTPVTIRAEIWRAPATSNSFSATGFAVNLLPTLGPIVNIGDVANNNAAAALSVATGDKLLMVFSINTAVTVLTTITGFASAGIVID